MHYHVFLKTMVKRTLLEVIDLVVTDTDFPFVSIIIPTRNREETIGQCIDSLLKLNYPRDKIEIIVVDNSSTDNTRKIVAKSQAKMIFEAKRGIPVALNTGVKHAKGDVIATIDDDSTADVNWLRNLVKHLINPKIGGAGGIRLCPFDTSQNAYHKFLSHLYHLYLQKKSYLITKDNFISLATGNLCYKKEVFNKINGYNSDLTKATEDRDFIWRAVNSDYSFIFEPTAKTMHYANHMQSKKAWFKWHMCSGEHRAKFLLGLERPNPLRNKLYCWLFRFFLFFSALGLYAYIIAIYFSTAWLIGMPLAIYMVFFLFFFYKHNKIGLKVQYRHLILFPLFKIIGIICWNIGLLNVILSNKFKNHRLPVNQKC